MEATMFSGWIYDHLKPHAAALKVAHPLMLRAIAAAKKKNDRIDANKICDCLRCDFLPECYMAPTAIRERRRTLRYRSLLVRQMVQMKIKIGTLLMEAGVSYNKQKLHKAGYFRELLTSNPDINEGLRPLLRLCRETVVRLSKLESALVRSLERDQFLVERVERLMSIPAIGPITALTWALEIGEVQRFSSIKKAISYCGLCGDERRSANSVQRTPLSKQRNKHLQTTLIEAAKMAARYSRPTFWWSIRRPAPRPPTTWVSIASSMFPRASTTSRSARETSASMPHPKMLKRSPRPTIPAILKSPVPSPRM